MITLIGIAGEPQSGKTTAVERVMQRLGGWGRFRLVDQGALLARAVSGQDRVIVPGDWRGGLTGGLDSLTDEKIGALLRILPDWAADPKLDGWAVLIEGRAVADPRLAADVERMKGVRIRWYALEVAQEVLQARHLAAMSGPSRRPALAALALAEQRKAVARFAGRGGVVKVRHHSPADGAGLTKLILGDVEAGRRPAQEAAGSPRSDQEANPGVGPT